jgi:hypothetical protein
MSKVEFNVLVKRENFERLKRFIEKMVVKWRCDPLEVIFLLMVMLEFEERVFRDVFPEYENVDEVFSQMRWRAEEFGKVSFRLKK